MATTFSVTAAKRIAQLALENYRMAEQAMEHDGSYANHLRFEAAKLDLNEALKYVRRQRGLAVHDGGV